MSGIRDKVWLVTEKVYLRVNDLIRDSGVFDRDNQVQNSEILLKSFKCECTSEFYTTREIFC